MANGTGQVPIIECTREAWQFLLRHWRAFLPAAIIIAIIGEIIPALTLFSSVQSVTPTATPAISLANVAALVPAMLASLMFSAAVLRKAVRDEFIGPTGLTFGADELRLLGVLAALMCMFVPLAVLIYFVVFILVLSRLAKSPEELQALLTDGEAFNTALQNALGEGGTAMFLLATFALMAALLYVFTRLLLINAATIGERRVVMFQTWSWSRGNVWRMLAAFMLTWLPANLIDSIVYEIGVSVLNAVVTPQNATFAIPVFKVIVTFVAAMLSIPTIALASVFYRGLRPKDFVAK
jgi:hypothetical protein